MGSGTTAIAALKSDRKFIGFDTNEQDIKPVDNRLMNYTNNLKLK